MGKASDSGEAEERREAGVQAQSERDDSDAHSLFTAARRDSGRRGTASVSDRSCFPSICLTIRLLLPHYLHVFSVRVCSALGRIPWPSSARPRGERRTSRRNGGRGGGETKGRRKRGGRQGDWDWSDTRKAAHTRNDNEPMSASGWRVRHCGPSHRTDRRRRGDGDKGETRDMQRRSGDGRRGRQRQLRCSERDVIQARALSTASNASCVFVSRSASCVSERKD